MFLIEISAAMYIWDCIYPNGEWLSKLWLSPWFHFACIYRCL